MKSAFCAAKQTWLGLAVTSAFLPILDLASLYAGGYLVSQPYFISQVAGS